MIEIGKIQQLTIGRTVSFGVYLTDGEEEVLLPQKYVPEGSKTGDQIEVFVYTDSMDRPVAVTDKPLAVIGDIVGLKVTHVSKFGAFMDIGLEKDLLVPFREQQVKMEIGKTYVVKVLLDHRTQRMIGIGKIDPLLSGNTEGLKERQPVEIIIWKRTPLGYQVVIEGKYEGLIYQNEIFQDLTIGEKKKAYIKKLRHDGKVDVALQQQGYPAVRDMGTMVLDKIKANHGLLDLGDKSDPMAIKAALGISKKNFKKILGGLYKAGLIEIGDYEVRLKKSPLDN